MNIRTRLGVFRVEFSPRGVCRLDFSGRGRAETGGRLGADLRRYTTGKPVRWRVPVDLSAGTAFQQAVWRALMKIPYGQTRSYGWVARQIGRPRAARAVGAACGANPVPILVPCHRVVAGDGSLGGFSASLARKRRLIALEKSSSR